MTYGDNKLLEASRLVEQLRLEDAINLMVDQTLDDPKNSRSLLELGMVLISARKPHEAISVLEKADKYNPHDSQVYAYLGQAYFFASDNDAARDFFVESLKIEQDNLPALNGLGLLESNIGKYSAANNIFTKIIDKYGPIPCMFTERAYARYNMGKLEEALIDCTSAINLEPDNVFALKSRSCLYSQLGLEVLAMQDTIRLESINNSREYIAHVKTRG